MKRLLFLILSCSLTISLLSQNNGLETKQCLSLNQCIEMAIENNISLRNKVLEVEQAKAIKKTATAEYLPSISVNSIAFSAQEPLYSIGVEDISNAQLRQMIQSWLFEYGGYYGLDDEFSILQNGVLANVMAIQPLYAGGRIRNGNKMASLGIEASILQKDIAEKEVVQEVQCTYWQLIALDEKKKTIQKLTTLLDTLDKDVHSAIDAGLALPHDALKINLKKKECQLNEQKIDDGIMMLQMLLAHNMGLDTDDFMISDTLTQQYPPEHYFVEANTAVESRPESELLSLALRVEDLSKKMTLGETLPSLAIGASYSYNNLFDKTKFNGAVFAVLQIPISDWYKTTASIKRHNLSIQIAENNRVDLQSKMQLQTNQAWLALQQSWHKIELAADIVTQAETNLKNTSDFYEAGIVTLSEVLEAQTSLQKCLNDYIDAKIEYQLQVIKYEQITQ